MTAWNVSFHVVFLLIVMRLAGFFDEAMPQPPLLPRFWSSRYGLERMFTERGLLLAKTLLVPPNGNPSLKPHRILMILFWKRSCKRHTLGDMTGIAGLSEAAALFFGHAAQQGTRDG